jgi:hypothetical protein
MHFSSPVGCRCGRVQAQLMDLLGVESEAEPELPGTTSRVSPPGAPKEPGLHPPEESSSAEAMEPRMRKERPTPQRPETTPAQSQEITSGRSAAFRRLDALYAKCQGAKGNSPKAAYSSDAPTTGSEELESSTSKGVRVNAPQPGRPSASKTTEAQRAAVMRLRANGCHLRPPGYESDESSPANVRMVRLGGAGTDSGSLLLTVLATRAAQV